MPQYYHQAPRLVQSFREFAEITENAAVTLKQAKDNASAAAEISFNLYTDPEKYELALRNRFVSMVQELEGEIADKYAKIDKLNFLTQHIVEAATLSDLISQQNGLVEHLNFSFNNLASVKKLKEITLTQADMQAYLRKTQVYVTKLSRYLAELKHNLDATQQSEFAVPKHMLADPSQSSEANPFAWFENLILKNGLDQLRNEFRPDEDELHYGYVSYDKDTEIKTSEEQDPETGEWETFTYKFSDFLLNRLYREFSLSKDLIEAVIQKKATKKEIKLAFEIWVSKLTYLKELVEKGQNFKKYDSLPKPLDALIKYLYDKYPAFFPKQSRALTDLLKKKEPQKLENPAVASLPQSLHPGVFTWAKNDAFRNSTLLHGALNNVFIKETTLEEFHRAFSGGFPENLQLHWIDTSTNNLHVNKVTLLYLFKRLAEEGLITTGFDDPEMLRKLAFIFRDSDGKTLENLRQSKQGLLKVKGRPTFMKKEIDSSIKALLA